jgi:hypothetical protein
LVYLTVKGRASVNVAFLAGLVYVVSPMFLVNEGYLWLSSQPLTFFLIGSFYFYSRRKPLASILMLSLAIMSKQEAVFLVPPFLVAYAWIYRGRAVKYIGAGVAMVTAISAPFLLTTPRDFIYSMTYAVVRIQPLEPSRLPVQNVSSASTSALSALCTLTVIPHVYTGTLCGPVTNLSLFIQFLEVARLNSFMFFISPILFVVLAAGIVAIRKSKILLDVVCIFALLGGLLLFSYVVHSLFAYYFVPVYALLLLTCRRGGTLIAITLGLEASVFLPESPIQFLIPLVLAFAVVIAESSHPRQDVREQKTDKQCVPLS